MQRLSRAALTALRIAELRDLAASLGIDDVANLRKGPLVDAISDLNTNEAPDETAVDAPVADVTTVEAPQAAEAPAQLPGDLITTEVVDAGVANTDPASPALVSTADSAVAAAAADEPAEPVVATVTRSPRRASSRKAAVTVDSTAATSVSEPAADAATPDADADSGADAAAPEGVAPKSARAHASQGITGIAEDLQELQRRETTSDGESTPAATDAPAAADGEAADAAAAQPEQGEGRRGRNRNRGRQGSQNGSEQSGKAEGGAPNGQQPKAQNNRQQSGGVEQQEQQGGRPQNNRDQSNRDQDDADRGDRGRGRYRDRKRRGTGMDIDEPEVSDDDVLIPVAGILDVLDNYAFVRTSGYLAGPNDVYVSLGQVKKYFLRKGDAVVGSIRQLRDGESGGRQKYNAIVKVDSINGLPVDQAEERVDFNNLTPLYPQERLRLETDSATLAGRIVDLVSPIGKGQRGLIVSPPKAGKTLMLQAIANAITTNNPEVHLMVVLVDERPEEVTDMQRTVKGEVIASTFDRPAEDHTTVAELAIERAKRLVELGYDVVVLLDSITRLGRAYNLATPASGHVLAGGVDAASLYPPKRFFGAARNIENGGSLTIIATALVETDSRTDEVIFEEFKGTGNMELRLSRGLADKRIFPAVDVSASGTRREEMLMGPDEVDVTWRLRRALAGLDEQTALDRVLGTLKSTNSNVEFLVQMQKSLPGRSE